jgi:hypothetical protein
MVLNSVVSSAIKDFGDLCPLVPYSSMIQIENPFLFITPSYLLDFWIEMVVPSLPALLAYSSWKMLCNLSPFLRTMHLNKLKNKSVFFFSPGTFHQTWIKYLLPSV